MNEYFKQPGQSSGKLAAFWDNGRYSPNKALEKIEFRYEFDRGNMLESLCWDILKGENTFNDRWFISEQDNQPPENIWWPCHNLKGDKLREHLKNLEVLTKKGERSKTYAKQHAYLDECLSPENFGKMPVSQSDYADIRRLARYVLDMPFPENHALGGDLVGDWLNECKWQKPYYWNENGIEKKALLDFDSVPWIADLKYTESRSNFKRLLTQKYWIQAEHYRRGAAQKEHRNEMFFIVGVRSRMQAELWFMDGDSVDRRLNEYDHLCHEYDRWERAGKPKKNYSYHTQRIWIR